MTVLKCEKVTKSYEGVTVLKEISFNVNQGEKVGLVGANGAGKSTLAKIIVGEELMDHGKVMSPHKVIYLEQSQNEALQAFFEVEKIDEGQTTKQQLRITSELGLDGVKKWDHERLIGLSGGEKTKLAISSMWDSQTDLLILDEPTNHLDQQGIRWLLQELRNFKGASIIISHDRYFLDQAVNKIVELENAMATEYKGNYTQYRQQKKQKYEIQLHDYEVQKKQEQKIETEIGRLKNWSNKAHKESRHVAIQNGVKFGGKEFYRAKAKKMDKQVKSQIKRLEKLKEEGVSKPEEDQDVYFQFQGGEKRGKRLIEVSNLTKVKGSRLLFESVSFYIKNREKVGVIGPNGCGKTTLLQLLLKLDSAEEGSVWISPTAKVGYLSQDVHDLNVSQSPLDYLASIKSKQEKEEAMFLLKNMGFENRQFNDPIQFLSFGERTKLKLARLLLQDLDVLILDEPTNHLDLINREQLEETLTVFQGTLLMVSHDVYFLNRLTDKLLVFEDQGFKRYEVGHRDFIESVGIEKEATSVDVEAELLLIENRLTQTLTKLSLCKSKDNEYEALNQEYQELLVKKHELDQLLKS